MNVQVRNLGIPDRYQTFRNRSFNSKGAKTQLAISANCKRVTRKSCVRCIPQTQLTVPNGATIDAGAKPYEMKLPISPMFMRAKPNHL